jgi:small acid-soluble spore protein H (minor)
MKDCFPSGFADHQLVRAKDLSRQAALFWLTALHKTYRLRQSKMKPKRRNATMNARRAKEILESADTVNVTYLGQPVMIQHVDEKEETARIYEKQQPEIEKTVPLSSLHESV